MRPTVTQQLAGTCSVLERIVLPEVSGTPAGDVLLDLVRNLRVLEAGWGAVLPFLHWDVTASAAVLDDVRPEVPGPLRNRIDAALGAPLSDPLDVDVVQARDDALRALLVEAVLVVDAGGPAHARIAAHLAERARQYPLRMVPDVPKAG